MGDDYAQALGEGIKGGNKKVTVLNLCNNRLTDKGAIPVIKALTKEVTEMDFSSNPLIGIQSYESINTILTNKDCKLRVLKLENNNLGDRVCSLLCDALDFSPSTKTLGFLNLNNNNITCVGAKGIADMLKYNQSVTVLFLNWNKIAFKGAVLLADALSSNMGVQILDLSYNSFGSSLQTKYN